VAKIALTMGRADGLSNCPWRERMWRHEREYCYYGGPAHRRASRARIQGWTILRACQGCEISAAGSHMQGSSSGAMTEIEPEAGRTPSAHSSFHDRRRAPAQQSGYWLTSTVAGAGSPPAARRARLVDDPVIDHRTVTLARGLALLKILRWLTAGGERERTGACSLRECPAPCARSEQSPQTVPSRARRPSCPVPSRDCCPRFPYWPSTSPRCCSKRR
jgi:hypothetical protein